MGFQRMGQKTNAGRFERGYLKVTTEKLTTCHRENKLKSIAHMPTRRETKSPSFGGNGF